MRIDEKIDKYLLDEAGQDLLRWKVTRIWYVKAKNPNDAIMKTKRMKHDEVEAKKDTKGAIDITSYSIKGGPMKGKKVTIPS